MQGKSGIVLCGGVFFTMLVEASKERISKRDGRKGKKGDVKDEYIMHDLVDLGAEGFASFDQEKFSDSVSKYKNCGSNYGDSMPFHNGDYKDYVYDAITEGKSRSLYLMNELIKKYLVRGKMDGTEPTALMVRKVMYVIRHADNVEPNDEFYADKNCSLIKQRDLIKTGAVDIAPFLLGVWNYILQNCPDNKSGKDTLKKIYLKKEAANDLGEYDPAFAAGFRTDLKVNYPKYGEAPARPAPRLYDNATSPEEDIPVIDGEVVDTADMPGNEEPKFKEKYQTFTNNGVFIDTHIGDIHFGG